ncbi:hypothetical protein [Symbiopectobacterium sp. RP]|uniref:hypothetical protein n=1 Tax=Symbiopectobacterium sp. RP TaxID=3248553 RepID=UPI003D2C3CF2
MITTDTLICGKKIQLIVIKIMSLCYIYTGRRRVEYPRNSEAISDCPCLCIALD